MFFRMLAALALVVLVGCKTQTITEYVDRPVEVKTIVTQPCITLIPSAPDYETQYLKPDDPIGVVAQAYRIERKQKQSYIDTLVAELSGCLEVTVEH